MDLKYYILPAEQMEPLARDSRVLDWASETYERKFSLVKAITISLGVPDFQHDLVNIHVCKYMHTIKVETLEATSTESL